MEDVYNKIIDQELLSGIQKDIYEILYSSGEMTVGEITCLYLDKYPQSKRSRNEIAKRVSDLAATGAIEKCPDIRRCPTTGKRITVWKISGLLPMKFKKNKNFMKNLRTDVIELESAFRQALAIMRHSGALRTTTDYGKLEAFYKKYFGRSLQ